MGETIIRIKIKAKGGVIIRIRKVRTIKGMDGGITRTICHQTELVNHLLRKRLDLEQALAQMLTSHSAFMNETKANMQQEATQVFLKLSLSVFSDIGLLVLSVIGIFSCLFTFRTRKHRYWRGSVFVEHYKSRESHLQEGSVSYLRHGLLNVQFDPPLSRRDVGTQRPNVSTSRRLNVATSILPFSGTS